MKIRQNKMMGYLAVTAGVGCAASVAEGAIVVVDLSGLSVAPDSMQVFPFGDAEIDLSIPATVEEGYLRSAGTGSPRPIVFYGDLASIGGVASIARGYASTASANFPVDPDTKAIWNLEGTTVGSGFAVGENWVAFKDSSGKYGWMSFTLNSLGVNDTLPISSFGKFVYDPASTSPANAITLQAAVAAVAAVPEPSGLMLLALGATGLAARRRREKAAA